MNFLLPSHLKATLAGLLMAATPLTWTQGAPAKPAPPAAPKPAGGGAVPLGPDGLPLDSGALQMMKQDGAAAFDNGDYKMVIEKLKPYVDLAEKAGNTEFFDRFIFMLGMAYATQQQWDPAIQNLKKYESKFPKGEFILDVTKQIGVCLALSGNTKDAITQFEKLRNVAEMRDSIMPLLGELYQKNDQAGEAVKVLEEYLKTGYGSTERINSALRLTKIYLESSQTTKGIDVLEKIKSSPSAADYVLIVNSLAMETAASLFEQQPELALRAFQAVRRKSEALRLQKERNDALRGKIAVWTNMRKGPQAPKYQGLIDEGNARLKQLEEKVAGIEKEENYDATIVYNVGRCFDKLRRYWEAELAFRTVLEKYPSYPEKSLALFGRIVAFLNLKMQPEALDLCWQYLKEYPETEQADMVSELAVTMAMEAKDFEKAKSAVDKALHLRPKATNRNKLLLHKIACDFEVWAFADARETLTQYKKEFPDDAFKEEVDYRYALTYFFENKYTETLKYLGEFVDKYPTSPYVSDARYRLNIVRYGEEQAKKTKAQKARDHEYVSGFQLVIDDVDNIIERFPNAPIMGELYALKGDCFDQMTGTEAAKLNIDQDEKSGDAYLNAALKASNDEVMEYGLEQGRTKLQALSRWAEVRKMYEQVVKSKPQHADRLKWIYWVCRALVKEAKTPEERLKKQEEVKKYLSDEILKNINKANQEGVEMLIGQLAQNCIPKRKPRPAKPKEGTVASPGSPTPQTAPEEDPLDVGAKELDKWLQAGTGKLNATGEARVLYAKTELARGVGPKIDPADFKKRIDRQPEIDKMMDELGQKFNPEDLSSTLLAFVGDHLRKRGVVEKATACFNRLIRFFPKSDYLDFGYVGLGDIAFAQKDYEGAEKHYRKAKDEVPGMKYPYALMGLGKTLIEIKNYKDPIPILTEIVGTKEWKGELTAEALYWLGECEFQNKKYPEAANYFQRIFLSFAKFPEWSIKGYIRVAECFRAMGETAKAQAHMDEAKVYTKKRNLETSPLNEQLRQGASRLGLKF